MALLDYEDYHSSIVGAWGLRLLAGSYSGPLFRVRNTSTNVETDVYPISGEDLPDWSSLPDAYALVRLYDQSGNGNDLVQGTFGNQPLIAKGTGPQGTSFASFDGSNDFMAPASKSTSLAYLIPGGSWYAVGRMIGSETYGSFALIPHQTSTHVSPFTRRGFGRVASGDTMFFTNTGAGGDTGVSDILYQGGRPVGGGISVFGIDWANGILDSGLSPTVDMGFTGGSATYPNATGLHLSANAVGGENTQFDFFEIVIVDEALDSEVVSLLRYSVFNWGDSIWRFSFEENLLGTDLLSVAELELSATIGGSDEIPTNAAGWSSDQSATNRTYVNAFDGTTTSYWESGAVSPVVAQVGFILPAGITPAEARLRARNDASSGQMPRFVSIEYLGLDGLWHLWVSKDLLPEGHSAGQVYSIVPEIEATLSSDYKVQGQPFEVAQEFSYLISGPISVELSSDYRIDLPPFDLELSSDYRIELPPAEVSLSSDYLVLGPVEVSLVSDYAVEGSGFSVELSSDWAIRSYVTVQTTFDFSLEEDTTSILSLLSSDYAIEEAQGPELPTLNLYPMEPVREGWAWLTNVNIAWASPEQRIAMRTDPRVMISYEVAIPDEATRLSAYQQLYEVVGTMPLLPMFSYATSLSQVSGISTSELFFDREKTWVQPGDKVGVYREGSILTLTVEELTPTGCLVSEALPTELDTAWEIMPLIQVRLPNLSSLSMQAVTGRYALSGEQCVYREFRREGSNYTLPLFEGVPVFSTRPIAVRQISERFDVNSEILDNDTGLPAAYSSFTNPFVDGTAEWLIDREFDMDFWRDLLWSLRGRQGLALMPTWREDLVLIDVQSDHLIIQGQDYRPKFEFEAYQCLQLESAESITWRRVTSIEDSGSNLRLNLSSALSDLEVDTLSFLNRVRVNSDVIYLDHYRHHSTISIPLRTVNQ